MLPRCHRTKGGLRIGLPMQSLHDGERALRRTQSQAMTALLRWALTLCFALALWPAGAWAGSWEAHSAQGQTLRIAQYPGLNREAYVLERFYADGTPDAGFGAQGTVQFTMGPDNEGPAALRVDALGRAWVAGASAGRGDSLQAVVLRFLPHGGPDPAWGQGGRLAIAPGGQRARALDILPQPDGSAYLAGNLVDANGNERLGWWRLDAAGKLDPSFGLAGLWADGAAGSTELVGFEQGADGSVGLSLRRGDGKASVLEAWQLAPGASQPALAARVQDMPGLQWLWRHGSWTWQGGPARPVMAPQTKAAPVRVLSPRQALGPAAGSHPTPAPPAPAPAQAGDPQPRESWPVWIWFVMATAVLLLTAGWIRRVRRG